MLDRSWQIWHSQRGILSTTLQRPIKLVLSVGSINGKRRLQQFKLWCVLGEPGHPNPLSIVNYVLISRDHLDVDSSSTQAGMVSRRNVWHSGKVQCTNEVIKGSHYRSHHNRCQVAMEWVMTSNLHLNTKIHDSKLTVGISNIFGRGCLFVFLNQELSHQCFLSEIISCLVCEEVVLDTSTCSTWRKVWF